MSSAGVGNDSGLTACVVAGAGATGWVVIAARRAGDAKSVIDIERQRTKRITGVSWAAAIVGGRFILSRQYVLKDFRVRGFRDKLTPFRSHL